MVQKIAFAVAGSLRLLLLFLMYLESKIQPKHTVLPVEHKLIENITPDSLVERCGKPWGDEIICTSRNGKKLRRLSYRFVYDGAKWVGLNNPRDQVLAGEFKEILEFNFTREKNETTWRYGAGGDIDVPPPPENAAIAFYMPCLVIE